MVAVQLDTTSHDRMAVDAGVGHDKVWVDHWYSEMASTYRRGR
jgi:hypothetical protein